MLLRIPPFRGAQVAAGVVVLTTLAVLLELRMTWSVEGHLAATGALGLLVWALVIGTPPAEGRARPWLASLCLSAMALLIVALGHALDLLGADGFYGTGGDNSAAYLTLGALVTCTAATWCARVRGAASCGLIAGLAGVVALVELADWIGDPSTQTVRWLLLLAAFVLLVLTLAQRDSRPLHAAQLANAGGLAIAAIGAQAVAGSLFGVVGAFDVVPERDLGVGLATGWELVLLAAGFGLLSYGAVDGQRGPVVVGLVDLGLFVACAAAPRDDLVGWPLFLLAAGVAFLVIGLRPTTPAPPEPGYDTEPPLPIEVHPQR